MLVQIELLSQYLLNCWISIANETYIYSVAIIKIILMVPIGNFHDTSQADKYVSDRLRRQESEDLNHSKA